MPEPPDFEEWARQIYAGIGVLTHGIPNLPDSGERIARLGIVGVLRHIWNARGAADGQALKAELQRALATGNPDGVHVEINLEQMIKSLDR